MRKPKTQDLNTRFDDKKPTAKKPMVVQLNAASYGQPPLPIGDMNKAGEK